MPDTLSKLSEPENLPRDLIDTDHIEHLIYADQIDLLYTREAPLALLWTALLGAGVGIIYWSELPRATLLIWLLCSLLLLLLRGFAMWRYHRCQPEPASIQPWGNWYVVITGLSGLSWGVLGFFLLTLPTSEQSFFLLLVLGGMFVGALFLLAVYHAAAVCFLLAMAAPVLIAIGFEYRTYVTTLIVGKLLLLLGLLVTVRYLNRLFAHWLRMRREHQALLEATRKAQLDPLTGLLNRQLLHTRLAQAIDAASGGEQGVAVILLDIMRFKLFNDSVGQALGDALLQQVAARVSSCISASSLVARAGSDEFAIMVTDLPTEQALIKQAQALITALEQPVVLQGQPYYIEVCLGISQYPGDSDSPASLMRHADQALLQAKRKGCSAYSLFKDLHYSKLNESHVPEQALRRALDHVELCLYYQPQIDLYNKSVLGAEALLRWNHPQKGLLSAAQVIPLAEETGLIDPIGRQVLHMACMQARLWNTPGSGQLFTVSVNVSAQQFLQADFTNQIENELALTGVSPAALKLEITESLLLPESNHIRRMLDHLKALGMQLAVDDFGTGYASLGYLRHFPLDWLKVDRGFVQDIASSPNDAAIVCAMIDLAHSLGMKVMVEGIENSTQLAFVQRRHSDAAQGYYIERPMAADALTRWLRAPTLPPFATDGKQAANHNVLLLEDDESQRQIMALWLREDNFQVLLAGNAQQAFSILAEQSVDVLVVDYALPDLDGIEFMRRVRAIYPGTVRLLISARTDHNALARAINEGGVFRFLPKPITQDQLSGAVRNAFQIHADAQPDPSSSSQRA